METSTGTQTSLTLIRRQLEPREAADRCALREALEQRVSEWKEILLANPGQSRRSLAGVDARFRPPVVRPSRRHKRNAGRPLRRRKRRPSPKSGYSFISGRLEPFSSRRGFVPRTGLIHRGPRRGRRSKWRRSSAATVIAVGSRPQCHSRTAGQRSSALWAEDRTCPSPHPDSHGSKSVATPRFCRTSSGYQSRQHRTPLFTSIGAIGSPDRFTNTTW